MKMSIRIFIATVGVLLVLVGLGAIKGLQISRMIAHGKAFIPPAQTVTAAEVESTEWEQTLTAVGSLEAVQGVMVTAELPGKVSHIAFDAGAWVAKGKLLVQQDVSEEKARLRAARSRVTLARKNLERARTLHLEKVIPDSDLDDRQAAYEQAAADADNIRAIIEKKTIRAPFTGRLGIRQINLGEVLESGQDIVSLQSMDPIYANFQLPQQELAKVKPGMPVRVRVDGAVDVDLEGIISAVNPEVDGATRNIVVQATLANADERLRPGMYATIAVVMPAKQSVLTIPATAVLFAPYSDSVFVVEPKPQDTNENQLVLRQQFVQLGRRQGDFIAVQNGLEAGQTVVSTGVFKLRNGMPVVVDNALAPTFELTPRPNNT